MKKIHNIPGFLSICLSVLAMAAGGGASVGISRTWRGELLFPEEKPRDMTKDLRKLLSYMVMAGKEETAEASGDEIICQGEMSPDGREKETVPLEEVKKDERSPERLNMAFYFDEEDSEEDVSRSYGGRLCELLSEKDSAWIQGIYRYMDTPPKEMAAGQGMDLGDISQWNKVIVTFRDGDGTPISGYSNAREIMSMASVYGYFNEWEDYGDFQEYAEALWKRSHSYQVSMSDVYYCEEECQYMEEGADSQTDGSGEAEDNQPADSGGDGERPSSDREDSQESLPEGAGEGNGNRSSDLVSGGELSESLSADSASGGEAGESLFANPASGGENVGSQPDGGGENVGSQPAGEGEAEESQPVSDSSAGPTEAAGNLPSGPGEIGEEADINGQLSEESQSGNSQSELTLPEDSVGGEEAAIHPESCPGHVDLNISIEIMGLNEGRNLYEADPAARQELPSDSQWKGWDEEARLFCGNLADQDWYDLYGLTSSASLYVRNPLTQSEIAFYLNKLPAATSPKRRELVRQALASVGCIPYYWGGKPSRGGLEGNGFGTVTEADEDGRILRGLDCSGWISWVYWTAFGSPLPAQSTSGLVSCGRGITKEELRAGDILIRTGEQPHVYLFLAWAEDGSMYLIHETTGYVNNVMIGTYDVELPHYRDLIGEE